MTGSSTQFFTLCILFSFHSFKMSEVLLEERFLRATLDHNRPIQSDGKMGDGMSIPVIQEWIRSVPHDLSQTYRRLFELYINIYHPNSKKVSRVTIKSEQKGKLGTKLFLFVFIEFML